MLVNIDFWHRGHELFIYVYISECNMLCGIGLCLIVGCACTGKIFSASNFNVNPGLIDPNMHYSISVTTVWQEAHKETS